MNGAACLREEEIKFSYETVEDAFYFVSSAPLGEHVAVLDRATGKIYYASDVAGHDDMPDDLDRSDDYIDIPHMDQLDRGTCSVTEFIRLRSPEYLDRVRAIFARPGAYSRYKIFLSEKDLLQPWYAFEMDQRKEALLEWFKERGTDLQPREIMTGRWTIAG